MRFAARIVLVLLAAVAAGAQETGLRDTLLDPFPVRDQYLLGNGFYSFEPEGAQVLETGEWLFDIHSADANTFSKSAWISRSLAGEEPLKRAGALATLDSPRYQLRDSVFLVDGQTHRTTLAFHRGIGSHAEIGLSIPVSTIGGGWADGTIEAVHKGLRIGNDERNALDRNSETVYVRTPQVTYLRDRQAGYAIGDVALTMKYEINRMESAKFSVAVAGSLELPTGNANTLDGSGSLDAGIRVIATRDTVAGRLHGSFGVLRLGANAPLGTRPQFLITDTVGIARLLTEATSVNAQVTISETPFRQYNLPEFNRRSYMLTVGARHVLRGFVLHAAFIENLVTYENSADAGLAWGISKRF
jgi:hypothetical protein